MKPNVNNKILYLSALCKNNKPDKKVMKLSSSTIKNSHFSEPKKARKPMDSRKFLLGIIPEFLAYAVEYSMTDVISDYYGMK